VPIIVEGARIGAGDRVLDIDCGTGGFAIAIAEAAAAHLVGLDESRSFIEFAERLPQPECGSVEWVVADAENLPFADAAFDRVLLSFVLHQLAAPDIAVAEAARALKGEGCLLVRTIAPEDARARVPARYFPSIAAADEARLPAVVTIEQWLRDAGLVIRDNWRVNRNAPLALADEERRVRVEVTSRFTQVGKDELEAGLERMRADAAASGRHWVDARPTVFVMASRQPSK
jgi:SAM-dependent methyltransferase